MRLFLLGLLMTFSNGNKTSSNNNKCCGNFKLRSVFLISSNRQVMYEFLQAISSIAYFDVFYNNGLTQVVIDAENRDEMYQLAITTNVYLNDIKYCFDKSEVVLLQQKELTRSNGINKCSKTLYELVIEAEQKKKHTSNTFRYADMVTAHHVTSTESILKIKVKDDFQ